MLDTPENRVVAGQTAAGFADALGLSKFRQAGCDLEGIESRDGTLRLSFAWAGVGPGVVSVSVDDGAPAFARTGRLAFRFVGGDVGRPYGILIARMAAGAGSLTMDDLLRLAGFVPAGSEEVAAPSSPAPAFNPVQRWGQEDGWRRFVCDAAMERRFREAFEFDSDSEFIVHGDLECRFVAPGARLRLPGHFIYPFDLFSHTEAVGPVTDLDDRDVIMDPSAKIESRVLREADAGVISGPVVVLSTCVPVVIAEDPAPVLARLAPVCPGGISYVTPVSPLSPSEIFMESFSALRREVLSHGPVPGSVGLVGYRPGRALDELTALLGSVGVQVNGSIVPLVTRRLLSEVLSAEAVVIAAGRYHGEIFDRLLEGAAGAGRRVLRPAFPWGIDATVEWLADVAGELGKGAAMRSRAAARASAVRLAIESMRPRDRVFLFVTDMEEMPRFADPLSPAGLPLIPTMCDFGLKSRLLVYCPRGAEAAAAGRFNEVFGNLVPAGLTGFETFSGEKELELLLRAPDAGAVFSEMFFDYRATRNGLAAFSSRIFEPGFDGAFRTVIRFRRLAGLPFYRRYAGGMTSSPADSLV